MPGTRTVKIFKVGFAGSEKIVTNDHILKHWHRMTSWNLQENTRSLCISLTRRGLEDLAKEELVENSMQASTGLYPSLGGLKADGGQRSQPSR